jgi:hypothetical protein
MFGVRVFAAMRGPKDGQQTSLLAFVVSAAIVT